MYLGNNAALLGCQEYFNRCAAAGSPIGATQTPSSYDNAASFNGTNQFLSIPSNSTLQLGGQAFSFSVWFNVRDVISQKPFLSKIALNNFEYMFGTAGSSIRLIGGNASNAWAVNLAGGNFSANRWNHAVCTYDGTSVVTIYLNGTSVGTSTASITTSGANQFQISSNSAYGEFLIGDLASVGFWKKALTASEVTQLWNSGAGRTYASLDSGLRTNLVSWWALNQNSVTADSHGTNTLTNNGTPLVTAPNIGPIVTTTQNSRQLINNVVKGIKSLGLWNSMVCWPLRSSQNAGGGTTAFSLGGLGRFNGTLASSGALPTWGETGVLFATNSANFMTFPQTTLSYPFSFSAAVMNGPAADASPAIIGPGCGYLYLSMNRFENLIGISCQPMGVLIQFAGFNTPNQALLMNSRVTSNTSMFTSANAGNETASTLTSGNFNAAPIDRLSSRRGGEPTRMPFALLTSGASVPNAALYALYRSTLGLGLGLP
jgi:hypothetical protein